MGKKTFTFFLYIVLFITVAQAQEKYVQRAMKYVEKGNVEKAKAILNRIDLENSESYITDYYLVKGYVYDAEDKVDSAMICYQKVLDSRNMNDIPNKVIVDYATSLYNGGRYDEAIAFINKADEDLNDTKYPVILDRIKEKAGWAIDNMYNYSSTLGRDSIVDVALGSNKLVIDVPRFGAAFYNDSLVFASYTNYKKPDRLQEEANEYNQILQDYQRTNTDLYIASLNDDFESRKLFAKDIASLENEGALTFSKDNTQMYYTRNVYKKGKDRYMIYFAKKIGKDWVDQGPLNFNSEDFNTMQPAYSPDGKGIYFVSNNPGGYGGYDIYFAEGSGANFKKPVNLGPTINSADNEIFPYMQNDTVMIYSSNGLLGFGGYDIYWVDLNSKNRIPRNLLQPINSNSDDYCIVGNRNNPEQMLFFSDRDLSMGNLAMNVPHDDVSGEALSFKISLLPPGKKLTDEQRQLLASENSLLKDKVKDNGSKNGSETSVADASELFVLLDGNGEPLLDESGFPLIVPNGVYKLGEDGKTVVDANGNKILGYDGKPIRTFEGAVAYNESGNLITADASDFFDSVIDPSYLSAGNLVLLDENGKPVNDINGNPIILSDGTYAVGKDGHTLLDNNGYPVLGADGKPVSLPNDAVALNDDKTIVTADASQFFGKGDQGLPVTETSGFASLYFDLNSSSLSDEAKQNLMMVAEYLKAKKAMKLVISGNAGLRGNESYNLVISAYRAYQAYEFMTETLGLSDQSILLEANGKYFPTVKTFDIEKGLENRRVDLKAQWAEPNKGLKVRFKITSKPREELLTNLMDLYLEQHPDVDYLYRVKNNEGLFRVAMNHSLDTSALKQINHLGKRDYLLSKEVIFVKEHSEALKDMVFDVRVKTLYYVPKDVDVQVIADKFNVSADELKRINKLKDGEQIKARSRLIIPINN
ncbi:OmpA family protein [Saccharicrinis sp. FJH54]|uniref:OmpA family protein n=1 Tax=Saccharicrinis sp. FJH54 TaxID=3344665 RepID=UPI0035D41E62